jgi:sulfur carrier protein ThiS
MNDQTLLDLAQKAASGDGAALQALSQRLADLLAPLNQQARDEVLFAVNRELLLHDQRTGDNGAGIPQRQVHSPELREWIRQQFPIEETLAALREVREKGGLQLADFIHELEEAARS